MRKRRSPGWHLVHAGTGTVAFSAILTSVHVAVPITILVCVVWITFCGLGALGAARASGRSER